MVLPFPECHIAEVLHYVASSVWLLSHSNIHLNLLLVFYGFIVHFFLALSNHRSSEYTIVYLSIHLPKDIWPLPIMNKAARGSMMSFCCGLPLLSWKLLFIFQELLRCHLSDEASQLPQVVQIPPCCRPPCFETALSHGWVVALSSIPHHSEIFQDVLLSPELLDLHMPQFSCLKNENGTVVMVAVDTEISVDNKKRIIAKIYIIYTVAKYYSKCIYI